MLTVEIYYQGKKHTIKLPDNSTIEEAIKKIKINPQTVIARRGKEIVPDTEKINNNDKIELIRIISGG